ncbi:MAG: CHAT domain-containing protein [Acidobacteria bacterium]|nr:CHAT domain-containing protein [Acidobacteriota bacterium]
MSRSASHRSPWVALGLTLSLLAGAHPATLAARAGAAATQSPDEAALRLLAGEFFARYAEENLEAFMSLWSAASPTRAARRQAAENFFAAHERVEVKSFAVAGVAVADARASVRVAVEVSAVETKTGKPSAPGKTRRVLELVREGGWWKVWRELSAAEELAERLLAAADEAGRAELLRRDEELLTPELAQAVRRAGRDIQNRYDYARALTVYQYAHELAGRVGDRRTGAVALFDAAEVRRLLGDHAGTLDSFHQSLKVAEELGARDLAASILNSIGIFHISQGAYAEALEHYRRSLALREALGNKDQVGSSLLNIGNVYQSLGDYDAAADYYRRSLELREAVGNKFGTANALSNIGDTHRLRGDYTSALEFQQRALAIREDQKDKPGVAISHGHLGNTYRARGDYERAAEHFRKRLGMWEGLGNKRGVLHSLNDLGMVSNLRKDYAEALRLAEQAAALAKQIGARDSLAQAHTIAGRALRGLGRLDESRLALEAAVETVESLRAKVVGQELRASYLASVTDPYELYIDLLMRMHRERPSEGHDRSAFQMSERARARSLLESLAEARVDIRQGVDRALVERERALQQQLNAMAERQTRLLSDRHTPEQAAALDREVSALAAAYREAQARIRRASPLYASLTQPAPLTLQEIQRQVLDPGTVLLQYALGEEATYLWAVTTDAVRSFELPRRAEVEPAARRVRDLLADAERWAASETAEAEYDRAARDLSRKLLPEALLAQLGKKRLVVVADGVLQYLPFGALPVTEARAAGARPRVRPKFLIDDHEVVSLPSASTLAVLRRETAGRARGAKAVAVFADPVFDAGDERVAAAAQRRQRPDARRPGEALAALPADAAAREKGRPQGAAGAEPPKLSPDLARAARAAGILRDGGQGLSRLPFSRREAEMILALAPAGRARRALDFEASRRVATSGELADYRFVHFATHGLLDADHPELSGVVLSLFDERGQAVDGFLRLHEVYNLRLPVELVVLSACQTALGREVRGEGLVGLARGFMYAGSPRVVASLWKVDDRATAELMRRFYEGMLKRDLPPAAALRRAKVSMLSEPRWRAPFYWAAFELQGEWK